MVNLLSFRFEKGFRLFTMLLVKGSSETWFFRVHQTTFFGVCKFQKNTWAARAIFFFWKCSKLNLNLENANQICKNLFVSKIIASENVAINCLSPKILHISQKDFLSRNYFTGINKYGKGALVQISTLFPPV